MYEQLDNLQPIRQQARRELLLESHEHPAVKLLRQIPSIGPIRAALLVALLQTPQRFRTKRQLWAYSGFAVETHDSGEYRYVRGKVRRNRERITVRGLNDNHNRDVKNLFKGAATARDILQALCGITQVNCYDSECYAWGEHEPVKYDASHLQPHFEALVPWGYENGCGGFGGVVLDVTARKLWVERNDRFEDYVTTTYGV